MITILASIILGFLLGMIFTTGVGFLWAGSVIKKRKNALTQVLEKFKSTSTDNVKERMRAVREITDTQLQIQSQLEMPQRNSLDGKHKNGLLSHMRSLEEEKIKILQSIIMDGKDPIITATDTDGVSKQMKLSMFMESLGIMPQPVPEGPLPEAKDNVEPRVTVKQVGKFTVYTSNKGDSGDTTH